MTGNLAMNEAIDSLVTDEGFAVFKFKPASDLFWREMVSQAVQHQLAQLRIALKLATRPAPCLGFVFGIDRFIGSAAGITLHLSRNCRWRAIQSCSNLPDRTGLSLKHGNLAAFLRSEM